MSYTPSATPSLSYHSSAAPAPPPKPSATPNPPHKPSTSTDYHTLAPPPPPRPQSQYDTPTGKYDHPPAPPDHPPTTSGLREPLPSQQPHQTPPRHTQPLRLEDGWLPALLYTLPKSQLQELLSSPSLQSALLLSPTTTHPSLTTSLTTLSAALSQNSALATSLVPLLAHLHQTRSTVSQHLLETKALEQSFRHKTSVVESALQPFSPQALHARLVAAINEQEGVCKGVEESFIEGGDGMASEREVEAWVREVRREREVLGVRKARRERWDEGRVGGWR